MMLQANGITAYHGRIRALHQVSLSVHPGEMVSIIGANGAGKSTLLGVLAGLYKPAQGEILLGKDRIEHLPAHQVVHKGISLVPEGRQVFTSLSVRENLILGMYHKYKREKHTVESKLEAMLEMFPGLKKHYKSAAGNMSGGEQQMLAIARGLMADPKIILLDEPSMGLAPFIVKEILVILQRIRDDLGTMVILVEQNVKAALKVADRVYVMDRGTFVLEGKPSDLLYDPMVQKTYLGTVHETKGAVNA